MKRFQLLGVLVGLLVGGLLTFIVLRYSASTPKPIRATERQRLLNEIIAAQDANSRHFIEAAKHCSGDIVVEADSFHQIGLYDDLISQLKKDVPEVESASPVMMTTGLLRIPGGQQGVTVQVLGIRLPEWSQVVEWQHGLSVQKGLQNPTFDPSLDLTTGYLENEKTSIAAMIEHTRTSNGADGLPGDAMLNNLNYALGSCEKALGVVHAASPNQIELRDLEQKLNAEFQKAEASKTHPNSEIIDKLYERLDGIQQKTGYLTPSRHIIVGTGIPGFTFAGDGLKPVRLIVPGQKVELSTMSLSPLNPSMSPSIDQFTIVDDQSTGLQSVDNSFVYVPFDTLQRIMKMTAQIGVDSGKAVVPAFCSQIHVRVHDSYRDGKQLVLICGKISAVVENFRQKNPQASSAPLTVQTWRDRQAPLINNLDQQAKFMRVLLKDEPSQEDLKLLEQVVKESGKFAP